MPLEQLLPPGPRAVSGPGAAAAPKAAGWELLHEVGGHPQALPARASQTHGQPLSCPGPARGWRCGMGAGRVRDKRSFAVIILLAVYEWSRPFPRAFPQGSPVAGVSNLGMKLLVWTTAGMLLGWFPAALRSQGLCRWGCVCQRDRKSVV